VVSAEALALTILVSYATYLRHELKKMRRVHTATMSILTPQVQPRTHDDARYALISESPAAIPPAPAPSRTPVLVVAAARRPPASEGLPLPARSLMRAGG
jgi:hypothetical protein